MSIQSKGTEKIHPVFLDEQDASYIGETTMGDPVTVMEWSPELSKLTLNDPEHYMPLLFHEKRANTVILAGAATNQWQQLQNLVRGMPGGPWHMDGIDNELVIKNSRANRPVIAEYTYANGSGELLNFKVKTKFMIETIDAERASDIDPDTGELNSVIVQGVSDTDAMYSKGKIGWWNRSYEMVIPQDNTKMPRGNSEYLPNFRGRLNQADFVTPEDQLPKYQTYSSVEDGAAAESEQFEITEEVVREYIESSMTNFNQRVNKTPSGNNAEEYAKYIQEVYHAANNLDGYTVKRKVYVQETVNPAEYAWDVNEPDPKKLKVYTAPSAQDSFWRTGYRHLQNAPNIVVVGENHAQGSLVDIIREHEVEVQIEAARILSSPYLRDIDYQMENDIVSSTQNRIKAEAEFLGNPNLESGQNIQINNISSRYTGTWYTKKVTHQIDSSSGYITKVEFNQKTVPVSKSTISSKVNTQKIYAAINDVATESWRTGAWKIPDQIEADVKQWRLDNRQELEGYSIDVIQDTEDPGKYVIVTSKEDFSGSTTQATEFKVQSNRN